MTKQRKVALFLVSFIAITIALLTKVVGGAEWTDAIIKLFGLFCAGNALEHISNGIKNGIKKKR